MRRLHRLKERTKKIFWAINGISEPHPLPIHVAVYTTAACTNGRHRNCDQTVHSLFRRTTYPCPCPCHIGGDTDAL